MSTVIVRYADTNRGDSLQAVALREMGDSARWAELIWLNDLIPPFMTDDPLLAGNRVLLSGSKIAIPMVSDGIDPDEIETFGTDVALDRLGAMTSVDGDLMTVSGFQNLKLALVRRVITEKKTKGFSPEYGCWISLLRGEKLGAAQLALAAFYVKSSLLEDDRISEVLACVAVADGESLRVSATVRPIDGKDLSLEISI